jgi:hypothetical protein
MPGSIAGFFQDLTPGARLIHGGDISRLVGIVASAKTGITALAGGGVVNATQLSAYINEVTTVATTNDSVKLQPAVAGMEVTVVNSGANALRVYAYPADPNNTIQGAPQDDVITPLAGGANVAFVTVPANGYANFIAVALGRWKSQNV